MPNIRRVRLVIMGIGLLTGVALLLACTDRSQDCGDATVRSELGSVRKAYGI